MGRSEKANQMKKAAREEEMSRATQRIEPPAAARAPGMLDVIRLERIRRVVEETGAPRADAEQSLMITDYDVVNAIELYFECHRGETRVEKLLAEKFRQREEKAISERLQKSQLAEDEKIALLLQAQFDAEDQGFESAEQRLAQDEAISRELQRVEDVEQDVKEASKLSVTIEILMNPPRWLLETIDEDSEYLHSAQFERNMEIDKAEHESRRVTEVDDHEADLKAAYLRLHNHRMETSGPSREHDDSDELYRPATPANAEDEHRSLTPALEGARSHGASPEVKRETTLQSPKSDTSEEVKFSGRKGKEPLYMTNGKDSNGFRGEAEDATTYPVLQDEGVIVPPRHTPVLPSTSEYGKDSSSLGPHEDRPGEGEGVCLIQTDATTEKLPQATKRFVPPVGAKVTEPNAPATVQMPLRWLRMNYDHKGLVPGLWYPKAGLEGSPIVVMHSRGEPRVPAGPAVNGALLHMSKTSSWAYGKEMPLFVETSQGSYTYYGLYVSSMGRDVWTFELTTSMSQYLAWRIWHYRLLDLDYMNALVVRFLPKMYLKQATTDKLERLSREVWSLSCEQVTEAFMTVSLTRTF